MFFLTNPLKMIPFVRTWYDVRDQSDAAWKEAKEALGWELPRKARWPLRLPIVRSFRYFWHLGWMTRHRLLLRGTFPIATREEDELRLYAIGRGWC